MAHPSPWRASVGTVGMLLATGSVFGLLVWADFGDRLGFLAGLLVVAPLILAELWAAFALTHRLGEFAGQIPGEPDAEASIWGDQRLHWPALGLSVAGSTRRFRVRSPHVEFDDGSDHMTVPAAKPREIAREALARLDRAPALASRADRFPSPPPRWTSVWTGVVATGVVTLALFGLVAVIGPDAFALEMLGMLALGPLAGVVRWVGLSRVRIALDDLVDGLEAAGVPLVRIDRQEGGFRPVYAVRTPQGTVTMQCLTLPRGKLSVSHVGRERRATLSDGEEVGREAAEWLKESAVSGPTLR